MFDLEVTGMTGHGKRSMTKVEINPRCGALEADTLPLGQRGGLVNIIQTGYHHQMKGKLKELLSLLMLISKA